MDRKQFQNPLASNQLIQFKLAEMATEISLGLHVRIRTVSRACIVEMVIMALFSTVGVPPSIPPEGRGSAQHDYDQHDQTQ